MNCPTCGKSDYRITGCDTHEVHAPEYEYKCRSCGDEWGSPIQEPCNLDTFDETMLAFSQIF